MSEFIIESLHNYEDKAKLQSDSKLTLRNNHRSETCMKILNNKQIIEYICEKLQNIFMQDI